jgi:hypothetical protein
MSSPLAMMSAAAVALAGITFLFTNPDSPVRHPDAAALAAVPAHVQHKVTVHRVHRVHHVKVKRPVVKRSSVYVDVYNNSNVTGLAGQTATRIASAGWQVVGSDNWYGTIPATTIYYPERLKAAALLLSKDLGIERVLPAIDPMSMDRLTVILTADYS